MHLTALGRSLGEQADALRNLISVYDSKMAESSGFGKNPAGRKRLQFPGGASIMISIHKRLWGAGASRRREERGER